jgi:hypothetical protein
MAGPGSVSNSSGQSSSTDDRIGTLSGVDPVTNNDYNVPRLAENEHRAVVRMKVLVVLTLVSAATALGLVTYILTSREEDDNFRSAVSTAFTLSCRFSREPANQYLFDLQFEDYVTELIEVSHAEAANVFGIMKSLSVAATSLALYKNDTTWPNFSIPHVAQRMIKSRELSRSTLIALSPVVEEDKRSAWEDYTFSTQEWVNAGLVFEGEEPTLNKIPFFIHSGTSDSLIPRSTAGPFSPIWQMSPAPTDTSIINYNLFENDHIKTLAEFVDTNKRPALSKVLDMTELFGTSSSFAHLGEKPESLLLQPIFEDFVEDAKVVGHFTAVLEWDIYFTNILHKGAADGIVIVVEDTCDEKFSFEVNGPNVTYLGDGDHHDKEYDDMVSTTRFASFKKNEDEASMQRFVNTFCTSTRPTNFMAHTQPALPRCIPWLWC